MKLLLNVLWGLGFGFGISLAVRLMTPKKNENDKEAMRQYMATMREESRRGSYFLSRIAGSFADWVEQNKKWVDKI